MEEKGCYPSGWRGQRSFDLVLALALVPVLLPVIAILALIVLVCSGRPVFYGAERMATPTRAFTLWKFRSMTHCHKGAYARLLGPDDTDSITPLGHWLRSSRMDELPQLWNILRGDMGFVGPRPPLRRYTDAAPEVYADVLRHRPGVTGLATVIFGPREAEILSHAKSDAEAHLFYLRRCVPRKAKLDALQARNASLRLTLLVIYLTLYRYMIFHYKSAKYMRQYHRRKI